ncbi:hypothetical protein [Rossellomorea aquimaris]|uniref:UDP-glucose/GDP-mannose dehydrogenase family protein n=1 Tax=Rossellomorea aquimaris TaxID=189382 RepID=A0A366EK24_9BACI|nr:hypothetical protein [Rossellomorea aquimaris]RBP02772.1 UDP-glucose/GDP-mannose dehydrogenase family protein [Rossellomorea aquimaris]
MILEIIFPFDCFRYTSDWMLMSRLSNVKAAVKVIVKYLNNYKVIFIKNTLPVGTNRKVKEWASEGLQQPIDVASNPEYLREGSAIDDTVNMDRAVIGIESSKS